MNYSYYHQIIQQQKMNIENTLNFCNQYLMLKVLQFSKTNNMKNTAHFNSKVGTSKKHRGQKIQNPNKKVNHQTVNKNQQTTFQKVKTKRKKFQGGPIKNRGDETVDKYIREVKQQEVQEGYVPIQNLLSQLTGKSQMRKDPDNFAFNSFGTNSKISNNINSYQKGANNYQGYKSYSNLQNNWQQPSPSYQSNTIGSAILTSLFPNSTTQQTLQPSRSDYLYQSPTQKTVTQFHVPVSRARVSSNLSYNDSYSNLSMNSNVHNKSFNAESRSKSRKKRNVEREFYMPVSIDANGQEQNRNLEREISRCASTNKMIAKLEKQIQQKNQEMEKSRVSDTRFQTKNKHPSLGKQLEQYSMIQLDNGVRESLSFVSEINVPPKPINIQLNR